MSNSITIKGYISQCSWGEIFLSETDYGDKQESVLTHRAVEITVPVHSLKFDPRDHESKLSGFREHKLSWLHEKKRQHQIALAETEEEIRSMLALENTL